MRIGIGLPATVPGVERKQLIDWARAAEQRGFTSLAVVDRLVYPNWDSLLALTAAAVVTERVDLVTSILISPYRNTAVLAKEIATVDQLSGGRLHLGLGLGARDDDYEASRMSVDRRGGRLEEQVDDMRRIWGGEKLGHAGGIGPQPVRPDGPPLLFGGGVPASFERAARLGDGWIMSGGTPDQFREGIAALQEAWERHKRQNRPRALALAYFALGADARERADSYIGDYYAWLGDETAAAIAGSVAVDDDMVRQYKAAFEQAGCDELLMFPCSSEPEQVDLLAVAAGLQEAAVPTADVREAVRPSPRGERP